MKNRLKNLWARRWLRWTLGSIVVFLLGSFLFGGAKQVSYELATVSRGNIVESVIATGQVKPEQYASLRFKTEGTIARMNVAVGDRVVTGQILASLDGGDLTKRVTQAEADLVATTVAYANAQQEVVDQRTRGGQTVNLLYTSAPNTMNEILNLVQQTYASLATFYDSANRLVSAVAAPILNSQRIVDAENGKALGDAAVQTLVSVLDNFPVQASATTIDSALIAIHQPLQKLQTALATVINAVAAIPSGSVPAATLAAYKDTLSTARTNMNSAISKESDLSSDLRDASVQNSLTLNTVLANERSAGANVEKAKAALEIARQSLSEVYLRAPMSGTIAAKSKQIGELVTTADQVYYLIGEGGLEVVANIPEVDIAKVSVGDTANIELDAYEDGVVLPVTISAIDPAETIVDGIATYKATFKFKEVDPRIRSGMTANIMIETDHRDNVLVIPQRAVVSKNGGKAVRVPAGEGLEPIEVAVELGLRGNNGTVEVLSGLIEGASIIVGTIQ